MALGFSTEAMVTLLTPKYMTYFPVLLIIFNIAVWSLQITLEPRIYNYCNLQQATRTIVFITKSHLGLNAVILIAWIALSCCTIPLFSFIMRRRDMATAAREAASKIRNRHPEPRQSHNTQWHQTGSVPVEERSRCPSES
ncbi:hypothetical protein BS47DRAFT_1393554 [Hydnum rufescens UP504]|uniref:DUF3533 domain-containing protein n=1 Tax=Hydnum rufescens UP504 TaxID=1448309 RepID=A0A9P6AWB9_9AGAM|nr:hypothetical protein BS47DRAFT_1393554 [Hydnum rufescens UP504]